jgi:SAM-dependent methyltransferase
MNPKTLPPKTCEFTLADAYSELEGQKSLPGQLADSYFWVRKLREIVNLFARNADTFPENGLFIELGCGKAREIWSIHDAIAHRNIQMVGTEILADDLKICDHLLEERKFPNIQFETNDLTKPLPWPDESVDIIYSSEVFEHIKEIDQLLKDIHRVLRPGGHLAFTTPNEPNLFQLGFYGIKRERPGSLNHSEPVGYSDDGTPLYGHVTLKTNSQWDALLDRHGFDLQDFGRGAIWYGGHRFQNHPVFFYLQRRFEDLLDDLPRHWTRNISDGVIALYRKRF